MQIYDIDVRPIPACVKIPVIDNVVLSISSIPQLGSLCVFDGDENITESIFGRPEVEPSAANIARAILHFGPLENL